MGIEVIFGIIAAVLAAGGLATGIASAVTTDNKMKDINATNQQNFQALQNANASAVYTRVQDLKRAGLSPTLAAGSAANTASAPVMQSANPWEGTANTMMNAANSMLNIPKVMNEIDRTRAETILINNNAALSELQGAKTIQDTKKSEAETIKTLKDADFTKKELEMYNAYGIHPRSASQFGGMFRDAMGASGMPFNPLNWTNGSAVGKNAAEFIIKGLKQNPGRMPQGNSWVSPRG